MEEKSLRHSIYRLEELQNKMDMIDSLAYALFLAAATDLTDADTLSGALYLLSENSNKLCTGLKELKEEMQALA